MEPPFVSDDNEAWTPQGNLDTQREAERWAAMGRVKGD